VGSRSEGGRPGGASLEDASLGEWLGAADRMGGDRWRPAADVYETEKAIVVRLELAGVSSAEVQVSVDGDVLRIRGRRQPRMEADAQRLHQMEIAFGPFERSLRIGIPFLRDQVSAQLEDGFLRVTLPKRPTGPRRIDVESGSSREARGPGGGR
jgi:HSP20 family protein